MINQEKIEKAIKDILIALEENPSREGLKDTPKRVAKMYSDIFKGSYEDAKEHLKTKFECENNQIVLVKDIKFHSMCEHHLLPFMGKIHVAYVPKNNKIVGLSKLVRVVETFSKRLQLQERLTSQIAGAIMDGLEPSGVMVIACATHTCMSIRGVKNPNAKTVTVAVNGIFENNEAKQSEVFSLLK